MHSFLKKEKKLAGLRSATQPEVYGRRWSSGGGGGGRKLRKRAVRGSFMVQVSAGEVAASHASSCKSKARWEMSWLVLLHIALLDIKSIAKGVCVCIKNMKGISEQTPQDQINERNLQS